MKNLFTLAAVVGFSLSVVSGQDAFLENLQMQTLAENNLGLSYDKQLACGGCVRSKYTYCRYKGDGDDKKGRDPKDRCCKNDDITCMWGDIPDHKDKIVCSTLDAKFKQDHKDETELYKDPFVMV
jgi:hypothetical protein